MIATAKTPRRTRATPAAAASNGFTHDPTTITLAWLAISLPLVAWDTGYVLGRPYTMPGGAYHWPLCMLPLRVVFNPHWALTGVTFTTTTPDDFQDRC